MKIKKFNTICAVILLGGAVLIPSVIGLIHSGVQRSVAAVSATASSPAGVNSARNLLGPGSSQVTTVAWRGRKGDMPGQATLKKWTVGDKTYYEVSGPINPRFRDLPASMQKNWGEYFACEVFFARGGTSYDQWLINPSKSFILHFPHPWLGDYRNAPHSDLPKSRFETKFDKDRVITTFWCNNNDTPRNIVFNYNNPSGDMSWVTTDVQQGDGVTNVHHHPAEWTDP
jgi:hypothetical protein